MTLRFVIIQVVDPHYHQDLALKNMSECEQLVMTFGGKVLEKSIQHRVKPHPDKYIGAGKVEWIKQVCKDQQIDVVVLNDIVNAGQIFRLEKELWSVNRRIAVWDRVDLILNIFEQHATTREAKIQIELARMKHIGPRVYGLGGSVLSRQGGGIGTRGLGETNAEIERRTIRRRSQQLEKELKRLTQERSSHIDRRRKYSNTAALVGYTSAGKTTLFNALTRKDKQTNPALFTTLESTVGRMKYPQTPDGKTLLVSDTIGFIENLPPFLIDAFRSTLLESIEATVLLHVVDAADELMERKLKIVDEILEELHVQSQQILVFNKLDLITAERKQYIETTYQGRPLVFVSATTREQLDDLKQLIVDRV